MEKIEPGKFVAISYDLYQVNDDKSETLVHQVDAEDPETFVLGVTRGLIVPLEKALEGMHKGDKFDVIAQADEAFGAYSLDDVVTLQKDIFEVEGKFDDELVQVGNYVPMMTADGYHISGKVLEITDKDVRLDFNHPLAGKAVRFRGEVTEVRDATPEDLQPSFGCGCGCEDHNCSDDACGCSHCH